MGVVLSGSLSFTSRRCVSNILEIIRADHSGFCFGVKRAIDLATEQVERSKKEGYPGRILMCGQLIHNRSVTERMLAEGVVIIDDISEAERGDVVIVRSHGEPKEFYEAAEEKGVILVDTTCIFVKKIHSYVEEAHAQGRPIVIVGSRSHQEVIATNGWCGYEAAIIEDGKDAERYAAERTAQSGANEEGSGPNDAEAGSVPNDAEAGTDGKVPLIVCQTTIRAELLDEVIKAFDAAGMRYEIKNTICNATTHRQDACEKLSKEVDAMIVIGAPNSSNSKKLYEIANRNCKFAKFIEDIGELSLQEFDKCNRIGMTAGASTPEWIIKEVISGMSDNVMNNNEQNPMMDFMDDIENSLRLPRPGEIVNGKVHQVMDDEVIVNIGCKKDGILVKNEVTLEEGQTLKDLFKEGDEIEAKVLKSDDGEGGILLSTKKLEINANYQELNEALESGEPIHIKFVKAVNGGVIAAYKEITGFVPMSQLSDRYVEKADEFIGTEADVKVIRVDSRKGKAVFSRKAVLAEQKRKQVSEIWENLNVGDIVEGKVMRFTDYGAFVDIGGVDGLLHISEISWGKLKHPQEVLNIGDIINVKILALNEEKGKISLGLKQTQPEPWTLVGEKYKVGQEITGKVVQIKEYGAFVELEAGLDGLVHISEIAHKRVENVSDELSIGQVINAKIMDIDPERKRISLSIKATLPDNEEEAAPAEEAEKPETVEAVKEEEPVITEDGEKVGTEVVAAPPVVETVDDPESEEVIEVEEVDKQAE